MPRLEQLRVWSAARALAAAAYRLTLRDPMKRHFALIDQIRRSAISVPSNIAEAYGLGTTAQFKRGTRIALGSAYELLTQLYLVDDLKLLSPEDVRPALNQCDDVIALLIAFLRSLGAKPGQ